MITISKVETAFPCEKIDIDGNLLVRWKGKDSNKKPIVLTSHLDVVAAEGDWKYPPFEGKIVDGKIYGRGSFDVKCGLYVIIHLQSVDHVNIVIP